MNVNELFRRLSYGELSNLALSGEGNGTITDDAKPKIISFANDGLLRLYSRFVLRENDLILELTDETTSYRFLKRYARSNPDPIEGDVLYIIDSDSDPFAEDLIRVLSVTNAVGEKLPLNDTGNHYSMFTPQPNVLQVPCPLEGQVLGVVYQARHPILAYDDFDAEISLPIVLEGALTSYIASKVFSGMNGPENSAKGQELLELYNSICQEVVDRDLTNESISTETTKFQCRGFI